MNDGAEHGGIPLKNRGVLLATNALANKIAGFSLPPPALWEIDRRTRRRETVYRLSDAVRSTLTEDGGIVLDIEHGQMLQANPVGAQILEWLKARKTVSEITNEIVRIYGISSETAHADLKEFLDTLGKHQLLVGEEAEVRS